MTVDARADRLHSKVEIDASGCWVWQGATTSTGYGVFWLDGKQERAHRAAWLLHRGSIPEGRHVLHTCDVRACVNPDHLYLGDDLDNARDRDQRRRNPRIEARRSQTHCIHGHPMTQENTYVDPKRGTRACRTCRAESTARRRARVAA